jgi:uncharacterized membrane protein YbhN (UPF0104 family)
MTYNRKRVLKGLFIIVGLIVVLHTAWRFPWGATWQAFLDADWKILIIALEVNLFSLVAKGSGWHLLLNNIAPNRWTIAQQATFVGAAVTNLSVSLGGEAARVHFLMKRDRVPLSAAVNSLIWSRAVEGIALGLFLLSAPALLRLPLFVRGTQIGVAAILAILFFLIKLGRNVLFPNWLPHSVRSAVASLFEMGAWQRLRWPILLAIGNWSIQWATFYLVLRAVHLQASLSASFMALLATNLGGILRLTPANVGVFQVAMVAALVQFGASPEAAMAASLTLQAIQVIPVLVIGLALMEWKNAFHLRIGTSPAQKDNPEQRSLLEKQQGATI